LGNNTHVSAQGRQIELADIQIINEQLTLLELIKTGDQPGDRRLPGAGVTYYRNIFSGGNVEIKIVEHVSTGRVVKTKLVEINFAGKTVNLDIVTLND